MKVTLKQIAEKTGVSINTVSLALRGMSSISDETRERVVRAARELGYHKQLKTPAGRRNLCLVSTGKRACRIPTFIWNFTSFS